jgi:hypothetical protein
MGGEIMMMYLLGIGIGCPSIARASLGFLETGWERPAGWFTTLMVAETALPQLDSRR